jgi:ferritin-like metal-binding protein YciE
MKNMRMLQELLVSELQDLLHAEGQLLKALPKMAKAAHDPKLKTAFEAHLKETGGQVERLNQAFGLLDAKIEALSQSRTRLQLLMFSCFASLVF